jgi:hypothetical protein
MMDVLREGGLPALVSLAVGLLALLTGGVAVLMLAFARRAAFAVGIAAIGLAVLSAAAGFGGTFHGKRVTDEALSALDDEVLVERIRKMGYAEAQRCGQIGFAASILPLVLGAIAAGVGSRAPRPLTHPGPNPVGYRDAPHAPPPPLGWGRTLVALGVAGFGLAAAGSSLAVGTAAPPAGPYGFAVADDDAWQLAIAHRRVAPEGTGGCHGLDAAFRALWLTPERPREMPRRFGRDPSELVPGVTETATRCARAIFEEVKHTETHGRPPPTTGGFDATMARQLEPAWTRNALLESPLLLDEALADEIAAWEPPPKPEPELAELVSSGVLVPETVRRVIQASHGKARRCYERGLAQNPQLAGKVTLELLIARSGEVSSSEITFSSLNDREVEDCLAAFGKQLTFPKPKGGTARVRYPIVFEPGDRAGSATTTQVLP